MDTIYKIQTVKVRLKVSESQRKKTNSPEAAVRILRGIYRELDVDQEHFVMLALNQKNNVTGYKVLFSGGMSESPIDFKIVFRAALLLGAASIIVCHNHPGGDPTPSWQDKKTTLGLNAAGDMIGIKVQDHIVLGNGRYWSFVERRVDADLIDRFLRKNRQGKKNTRGARG